MLFILDGDGKMSFILIKTDPGGSSSQSSLRRTWMTT